MKTTFMILLVAAGISGLVIAQQNERAADNRKEIVVKLGEIVKLRERLAENYGQMLKAGRAEPDFAPEIELAEARLALANEQGNRDDALKQLKAIVAANEARVERLKKVAWDRISPNEMERRRSDYWRRRSDYCALKNRSRE
jgi:hypothetical protein